MYDNFNIDISGLTINATLNFSCILIYLLLFCPIIEAQKSKVNNMTSTITHHLQTNQQYSLFFHFFPPVFLTLSSRAITPRNLCLFIYFIMSFSLFSPMTPNQQPILCFLRPLPSDTTTPELLFYSN